MNRNIFRKTAYLQAVSYRLHIPENGHHWPENDIDLIIFSAKPEYIDRFRHVMD